MSTTFPPPATLRRRTAGAWVSAALAVALLTGCAGDEAPAAARTVEPVPSATSASAEPTRSAASTPTRTAGPSPTPTPERTPGQVASVEAGTPSPESPSPTSAESSAEASGAAAEALAQLTVGASGAAADYDRDAQFGDWADPDGNGCDARNDILARDLVDVVSEDGCKVLSGTLADPYTGTTINFTRGVATSSDVQIDHVVALQNAWISGANNLTQAQRVALANDPLNLQATDGPTNGAKSASPADQWLPPNEAFRCQYVATQIAVKAKYDLRVTVPEKTTMENVLADCPGQQLPDGGTIPQVPVTAPVQEEPAVVAPEPVAPVAPVAPVEEPVVPAPAAPAAAYANCSAAKAAGAAPLYVGSPGYSEKLDRDRDGVACES